MKFKLALLVKVLCLPCFWLLYLVSKYCPKINDLWAFGSRNGEFVDNPKYLFLHVNLHCPEVNAYWISDDKGVVRNIRQLGYKSVYKYSVKGLYLALRAKCFVYAFDSNDINFWASGGAKLINLYHGIPLKKIEFDTTVGTSASVYHPSDIKSRFRSRLLYGTKWQSIDLYQVQSSKVKDIIEQAFNFQILNFAFGVNPRLQPLLDTKELPSALKVDNEALSLLIGEFDNVWLYMPTWRVNKVDILASAFPDLSTLNSALQKSNTVLILKMHLYTEGEIEIYSNIKLFPREVDVYPFLPQVDVLVTDYSSIFFDFCLLNRPIIFYSFDLEEYLNTSSDGFYFDYDKITSDCNIKSFNEFVLLVENHKLLSSHYLSKDIYSQIWTDVDHMNMLESNNNLVSRIKMLGE